MASNGKKPFLQFLFNNNQNCLLLTLFVCLLPLIYIKVCLQELAISYNVLARNGKHLNFKYVIFTLCFLLFSRILLARHCSSSGFETAAWLLFSDISDRIKTSTCDLYFSLLSSRSTREQIRSSTWPVALGLGSSVCHGLTS